MSEVLRCPSGVRCRDGENIHDETGERIGRVGALLGDGVVCAGCERATAAAVRYLPADYRDLSELLAPSLAPKFHDPEMPYTHSKAAPKLPLRDDVLALQELIVFETVGWAESVADRLGEDWDTYAVEHSRPAERVEQACRRLGYRLDTLLSLGPTEHRARSLTARRADGHDPDRTTRNRNDYWTVREGWEAGLLLRELHDFAERLAGRHPGHRILTPCPACHRQALVRRHRDGEVVCRSCEAVLSDEDYQDFFNAALRAHDLSALADPEDAA